jgi:hypothetical protein
VHLTPKAGAFFAFAISEQNFAFAKSSLAFGAGDQHVILSLAAGKVRIVRSYERQIKKSSRIFCNPNRNNEYRL